jgi:nucleotide-binding universal stress UspA family protein
MIRNLFVALDGSAFGEHALPLALSIARRTNAHIHISLVHRPLEATYAEIQLFDDSLDQDIRKQEAAYLANISAKLKEAAPVTILVHHEAGDVATVLRAQAERVKADLILMTTHARGAFGRFWLGSNTDEMVRHAPAPILLVHPASHAPNLNEDVHLDHWMIPLDGSPVAEEIVGPAMEVGKVWNADYTLLRIIRPVVPMPVPVGLGTFGAVAQEMAERVEGIEKRIEDEAAKYLGGVAQKMRDQNANVKIVVAFDEQPGVGVLNHAKPPIDAIALMTHGRKGLSRLFLGSVADKIIRASPLPVLVYHTKG